MSTLHIVLPIEPGLLAINRRSTIHHRNVKIGEPKKAFIGKTEAYKAACEQAILAVRQARVRACWKTSTTPVSVVIHSYWPEAKGDVDACTKAVCDALQHGLAVANDELIEPCLLRRTWRSDDPRIEVTVTDEETT